MLPSFVRSQMPSSAPRRIVYRVLLLGGALVALWVLVQATALVPSATASIQEADSTRAASSSAASSSAASSSQKAAPPQNVVRSDEDRVTATSSSASHSGVEVFTWGNTAAILLLIAGGGYALYLHRRGPATTAPSVFQPVGQFSLGQSQQLRLVACGGEVLLLGVTAEEVTLLKTYPQDVFDDPRRDAEKGAVANGALPAASTSMPAGFSDVLNRVLRQNASA